ncbi:unnamed protein product, partial [Durusdinium trenchii]
LTLPVAFSLDVAKCKVVRRPALGSLLGESKLKLRRQTVMQAEEADPRARATA